jgi:subtilisin family serine protease
VYAEPNYTVEGLDTIPNDPSWANQYGLTAIHAPQGWDISTGSASVIIAILDTGVDLTHPDIAVKIVPGYDFVNSDSTPQDDNGHGTHVAGIAAASSNNGEGVAGVSWGARVMPVKVLNAGSAGTYADVAAGILWATDHGAQIINMSLGGPNLSSTLSDAVDYAASRGVLLVAAAGNNSGNVLYPAAYTAVIAVAATDFTNTRLPLSNFGPELDVSAPGGNIYSLNVGGGYIFRTGTSMAAPHVSGLAAVLFGIPGNASASLVRSEIEASALDLDFPGWDAYTGFGLIQMDAALALVPPVASVTAPSSRQPARTKTNTPIPLPFFPPPVVPSLTPSPTPTPSLTATLLTPSATLTPSPVLTSERTLTPTFTISPPIGSSGDVPPSHPPFWILCLGLGFLLAGILLAYLLKKARQYNYL